MESERGSRLQAEVQAQVGPDGAGDEPDFQGAVHIGSVLPLLHGRQAQPGVENRHGDENTGTGGSVAVFG